LLRYSQESSWWEDNRRVSNGEQVSRVATQAMKRGKSVDVTGYWQRLSKRHLLRYPKCPSHLGSGTSWLIRLGKTWRPIRSLNFWTIGVLVFL